MFEDILKRKKIFIHPMGATIMFTFDHFCTFH